MHEPVRETLAETELVAEEFEADEVEEALQTTFGYAQAEESNIKIDTSEEALKRSIFSGSISTALAHELSPSQLQPHSHRRSHTLPTTFLHSPSTSTLTLSHPHLSHALYGTVHSHTTSALTLGLTVKPLRNGRPEVYSESPTPAFAHLNKGDPIILLTCLPLPPSITPKPRHSRPLSSYLYNLTLIILAVLALLIFLAPPPTLYFLLRPSSSSPSLTAIASYSHDILLAFVVTNAGVFGAILWTVGRWFLEGDVGWGKPRGRKANGRDNDVEDGDVEDANGNEETEEIEEAERGDANSVYSDSEHRFNSKPGFWSRPVVDPSLLIFAIWPLWAGMISVLWYWAWVNSLMDELKQ
jgi:hypothetical protein